jgi:hypothetical protein
MAHVEREERGVLGLVGRAHREGHGILKHHARVGRARSSSPAMPPARVSAGSAPRSASGSAVVTLPGSTRAVPGAERNPVRLAHATRPGPGAGGASRAAAVKPWSPSRSTRNTGRSVTNGSAEKHRHPRRDRALRGHLVPARGAARPTTRVSNTGSAARVEQRAAADVAALRLAAHPVHRVKPLRFRAIGVERPELVLPRGGDVGEREGHARPHAPRAPRVSERTAATRGASARLGAVVAKPCGGGGLSARKSSSTTRPDGAAPRRRGRRRAVVDQGALDAPEGALWLGYPSAGSRSTGASPQARAAATVARRGRGASLSTSG